MGADDAAGALSEASAAALHGAAFDGALYAANTAHHRAFDDEVLGDVPLSPGTRVLDLGCGSGDLTSRLGDLVSAGSGSGDGLVVGVDSSQAQVDFARSRYARPGVRFLHGRAQDLGAVVDPETFDVVVSVAMLHWVPASDQRRVLEAVRTALRPGGVFRADLGGAGQIEAARTVLDAVSRCYGGVESPWFFPDAATYSGLLEAAGLVVRRVRLVGQRRSVPDEAALEGWLTSQVLPAYLPAVPPGQRTAFVGDTLAECRRRLRRRDAGFDQDYVRVDVLATCPLHGPCADFLTAATFVALRTSDAAGARRARL